MEIEKIVGNINEINELLADINEISYFEAIPITIELIQFHEHIVLDASEGVDRQLSELLYAIPVEKIARDEMRFLMQFIIMKGFNQLEQTPDMTPNKIAFLMANIVNIMGKHTLFNNIMDPAIGTGNLLYTVVNNSPINFEQIIGYDINEQKSLIAGKIGDITGHQTIIETLDVLESGIEETADLIVCEPPVYQYKNLEEVSSYAISDNNNNVTSEELYFELIIKILNSNGYAFIVANANLFSDNPDLMKFINQEARLIMYINLPEKLFADGNQKAIYGIKKTSDEIDPLVINLTNLEDEAVIKEMIKQIDEAFSEENRDAR